MKWKARGNAEGTTKLIKISEGDTVADISGDGQFSHMIDNSESWMNVELSSQACREIKVIK